MSNGADASEQLAREMIETRVAAAMAKGLGSPAARSEVGAMLADLATDLHRIGDLRSRGAVPAPASVAESLPAFLARVRQMPEPSWFIKDLVPDEGVVVWHCRPRSMKSLTAEDALLSLALGEECALRNQRFAIKGSVGVLWLGEEDSERLDAFRFGLMLQGRDVEAPEAFRLVIRPGWDLESPAGQAELLRTINDTSAAMVTPLRVLVIAPFRVAREVGRAHSRYRSRHLRISLQAKRAPARSSSPR